MRVLETLRPERLEAPSAVAAGKSPRRRWIPFTAELSRSLLPLFALAVAHSLSMTTCHARHSIAALPLASSRCSSVGWPAGAGRLDRRPLYRPPTSYLPSFLSFFILPFGTSEFAKSSLSYEYSSSSSRSPSGRRPLPVFRVRRFLFSSAHCRVVPRHNITTHKLRQGG